MKRGLKKTLFMVKGAKKRSFKKRGVKHNAPNGMITNPIVSAGDLSQNTIRMGPSSTSTDPEEVNEHSSKE